MSATDIAPATIRSHSARLFWIPFAFIAVLASLWALASPLFSIPDENAHATKAIAQVRGELVGAAEAGKKYLVVDLPPGYHYNHSAMCYLFVPTKSAHCAASYGDGTGTDYFENWVGAYNPIYYYLVGWPSLLTDNGAVGVYAMRIASALLGAALLAWAFQSALSSIRSRWLPLGLLLVAGPMVLYLVGSVNPNGVEIAAAAALWASLLRLLERHDDRLEAAWSSLPAWYLWLIVTVSSILLANARSVGPLWLVIVVAACVGIAGRRAARAFFTRGRNYRWIAVIAAGTLFAGVWTLATNGAGTQAGTADAPLVGKGFFSGFAAMIRFTPNFLQEQLGVFGWLDTPLPWILYAAISIAIGVVVVLAVTGTDRRTAIVVLSALAATILVPALVQGLTISRTGLIWQGRYGLFLFLAVPLLASWMLSTPAGARLAFLSVRVGWIGLGLAGFYSIVGFFAVLRRFVTGFGAGIGAMFHPDWQPPLGWEALVGLYALAMTGFVLWLGFRGRRIAALEDGGAVATADRA